VKFQKFPASTQKPHAFYRSAGKAPARFAAGALLLCGAFAAACSSNGSDDSGKGGGSSSAGTSAAHAGTSNSLAGATSGAGAGAIGGAGASVGGGGASGGSAGSIGGAGTSNSVAGAGGSTAGAGGSTAGGGGAGGSAGSAACITQGSELCDDFESGALDAAKWKQSTSANTSIKVETGRAHSGQYAVHLKFVAGSQNTVTITEGVTFPASPNKFYSRMWAYFSPDIPKATNMDFHTGFMMGGGNNDKGTTTLGMGMIGSDQQYLGYSIFFGDPKYEFGPWSNTRIVPNQWLCIELFEDGSDPTTEKRQVWLNDVELKDIASDSAKAGGTQNPNHLPPKFDKVTFGVTEYHPIPTLSDMWIDDVRVSAQKIGCAK